MKKLIAAVTTAGLLIVGTAGVAQAAETPSGNARAKVAVGRGRRVAGALKVAATTIGIEPKELWKAIKDGQSVAEVATSHNVAPQVVIDAVVAAADKRVDDAVAAGKLDADRAATVKTKISEKVNQLANGKLTDKAKHRIEKAKVRRHARRGAGRIAADVIGIEPKDLAAGLKDGKSVAAIAQSHSVDPQKVIDAVVAAGSKKVDDAVASGRLDAERAAKVKDRLTERVTKLVNATPHARSSASS
jgi:polyhydroxyalkanoate synthesis regulator phasin